MFLYSHGMGLPSFVLVICTVTKRGFFSRPLHRFTRSYIHVCTLPCSPSSHLAVSQFSSKLELCFISQSILDSKKHLLKSVTVCIIARRRHINRSSNATQVSHALLSPIHSLLTTFTSPHFLASRRVAPTTLSRLGVNTTSSAALPSFSGESICSDSYIQERYNTR